MSNLSTMATLGTPKKCPFYIGGHSVEVFQQKLICYLVWTVLGWPLLTGGCCSEEVVNTGLAVCTTVVKKDEQNLLLITANKGVSLSGRQIRKSQVRSAVLVVQVSAGRTRARNGSGA
jgi:hypothetical protein